MMKTPKKVATSIGKLRPISQQAGYALEPQDQAWADFEAARATYAPRLEVMARYFAMPGTQWLGDSVALRQPLHPVLDP